MVYGASYFQVWTARASVSFINVNVNGITISPQIDLILFYQFIARRNFAQTANVYRMTFFLVIHRDYESRDFYAKSGAHT
jgi:hypothetical protein